MSQERSTGEPSMEEILSSIRRIIADEQKGGPDPVPPVIPRLQPDPGPTPADPDDDVLELTDIAEDEEAGSPTAAAAMPPSPPKETAIVTDKDEGLLSPSTASASTSAFAKLARSMAPEDRPTGPLARQSVEELLLELLRPALKEWLDKNLPSVVERVVEQEVKKLARRAELS
jgi:cell pole-organizing protein PopZ